MKSKNQLLVITILIIISISNLFSQNHPKISTDKGLIFHFNNIIYPNGLPQEEDRIYERFDSFKSAEISYYICKFLIKNPHYFKYIDSIQITSDTMKLGILPQFYKNKKNLLEVYIVSIEHILPSINLVSDDDEYDLFDDLSETKFFGKYLYIVIDKNYKTTVLQFDQYPKKVIQESKVNTNISKSDSTIQLSEEEIVVKKYELEDVELKLNNEEVTENAKSKTVNKISKPEIKYHLDFKFDNIINIYITSSKKTLDEKSIKLFINKTHTQIKSNPKLLNSLYVYKPNNTSDYWLLDMPDDITEKEAGVYLVDSSGKVLSDESNNLIGIDMNAYKSGFYYIYHIHPDYSVSVFKVQK